MHLIRHFLTEMIENREISVRIEAEIQNPAQSQRNYRFPSVNLFKICFKSSRWQSKALDLI